MSPETTQIAVLIAIGVVILALLIWMFTRANRKTTVVGDESARQDVLDDGAAPAARNQALIDAPQAASDDSGVPLPTPAPEPVPEPQAAPQPDPEPQPEPAPAPEAAQPAANAPAAADALPLTTIKGLGPKIAALLQGEGITTIEQIAAFTDEDVARIDALLGRFSGRITRDQWVEQAKLLTTGDGGKFAQKYGQDG